MNRGFKAAIWMEILKVRRTRIFPVSIYFFLFMGVVMGMLMYLASHPEIASRSSTFQMKTSFIGGTDWKAYFGLLIQINLTVGVIGSGVITSWVFGREFSDRVVKDLLALPVPRAQFVLSKLLITSIWNLLLAVIVLLASLLTGWIIGLAGMESAGFFPFIKLYFLIALLNTLLITPVAFVASAGRGYLLPISFVILIMILTQLLFVGIPSFTLFFPWAFPALCSGVAGPAMPSPGAISYVLYFFSVLLALFGTLAWWRIADQK